MSKCNAIIAACEVNPPVSTIIPDALSINSTNSLSVNLETIISPSLNLFFKSSSRCITQTFPVIDSFPIPSPLSKFFQLYAP